MIKTHFPYRACDFSKLEARPSRAFRNLSIEFSHSGGEASEEVGGEGSEGLGDPVTVSGTLPSTTDAGDIILVVS